MMELALTMAELHRHLSKPSRRSNIVLFVWPFDVPDISKDHGVSEQVHQAAMALANSMTLEEVAKRTFLSVISAFFAAWLAKTLLHQLTEHIAEVCPTVERISVGAHPWLRVGHKLYLITINPTKCIRYRPCSPLMGGVIGWEGVLITGLEVLIRLRRRRFLPKGALLQELLFDRWISRVMVRVGPEDSPLKGVCLHTHACLRCRDLWEV